MAIIYPAVIGIAKIGSSYIGRVRTGEFEDNLVHYLRKELTDYNSTNRTNTQWIYPHAPRIKNLGINDYPLISITPLFEGGETAGTSSTDMVNPIVYEIVVWTRKGLIATNKEGHALANQIARDVVTKLRDWKTKPVIANIFYDYDVANVMSLGYDEDTELFRHLVEINVITTNAGENV